MQDVEQAIRDNSAVRAVGTIVFENGPYKEKVVASNKYVGKQIVHCGEKGTCAYPLYRIEYASIRGDTYLDKHVVRYSLESAKMFYRSI